MSKDEQKVIAYAIKWEYKKDASMVGYMGFIGNWGYYKDVSRAYLHQNKANIERVIKTLEAFFDGYNYAIVKVAITEVKEGE